MKVRLDVFVEALREEGVYFDHEGADFGENPEEIFGKPTVFYIDVNEYVSNSGNHKVTSDLAPDIIDRHYDYYIAVPLAEVYINWGTIKGTIKVMGALDELPGELRDFLKKLDGIDGRLADYNLSFLLPAIEKAGLNFIAWKVCEATKVADILIVRAPRTEREAAEWLADWAEEAIPRFLARKLAE